MHGKTVPQRLWIDGRERKLNSLFPDSVDGVSLDIGNYCTVSLFFEQDALSK